MKFFHYVLMSPELSRVRWRAILSTAIVLGGLAAGIGVLPAPQHVRAEGIVEADHDTLFTKEEGFVATVLPSGTSVTPDGEPILVCENPDLQSRLRELLAHRRELTVRRRMARQEEPAAAAILDERIAAADERIKRIRQRIADLRLHPNREGVWLTRHDETINGAYLQRGKPLGIVAAMDQLTIRATAGQDIAHRILGNVDHLAVEIRLRNRPDLQLTGRVERISPAGRQQLPSAALGFAAGGSMATDPDDPEGMQTTERFFEVHIQPDEQSTVPLLAGQRVLVRFTLPEKPLAVQWYQRLLQLIQQRFQI
jgi:putative peptide zinc metalloprotease protein